MNNSSPDETHRSSSKILRCASFFNSLLVVSSGDELLRLMLDILLHVLQKTSQEVSRRSRTVDVKEMK